MISKISSFFLLFLLISGCTTQIMIDNPTDLDIAVSIDEKLYKIPAFEFEIVDVKETLVNVSAKDEEGNDLINEEVDISGEGILNITRSTYVIWNDIYCLAEDYEKFKDKLDLKELVIVNEKEYEQVDFTIVDEVFIPKTWDYNLDESSPDSVNLENDYLIKSKIYSVQDLEDEFGYFGDLDFSEYKEEDIDAFLDSLKQVLKIEEE